MTAQEKIVELKKLGRIRQSKCYPGFFNISDFNNGIYESDFVSPYTKGSCNTESGIFVLLQDWTSRDRILKGLGKEVIEFGYTPTLPTNKNLNIFLLKTFNKNISDVFTTNLFPFIKPGGMNADISNKFLKEAFHEFALPQINIVKPKLVICCGAKVYNTAFKYFHGRNEKDISTFNNNKIQYFKQSSPGAMGTNSSGGINQVINNWQPMKQYLL